MFSFAAIGLRLLGIRKAIGRAFAWATQSAAHIFAIGMVFALVWGYIEHRSAAKWKASTEVAQVALKAQQAAIVAAQKQAEAMEAARLARVTKQQEGISHDVSQDYARRLADLRARYDRLRKSTQSSSGAAESVALSGVPNTSSGNDGTPGNKGFSLEQRLVASKQAEQLDALITWVERQSAVNPNE